MPYSCTLDGIRQKASPSFSEEKEAKRLFSTGPRGVKTSRLTSRFKPMRDIAYKVLTEAEFTALQASTFHGAPVDLKDGYIHLSTAAQLDETIDKHFAGQTRLMIAAVDLKPLAEKICWEPSRNGALFPHLYGRLEPENILAACPLARGQDGRVKLPGLAPLT
jgi:uncharacterized protein (DUF952 family)